MTDQKIVKEVIAKAGGMRALGRALGINYQAIQSWKKIPAERISAISAITGLSPEELRPDLFKIFAAPRHHPETTGTKKKQT